MNADDAAPPDDSTVVPPVSGDGDGDDGWLAPSGPAMPDPDAADDAEIEGEALPPPTFQPAAAAANPPTSPPEAVTPLAVADPVAGQPWIVRAESAAGVSSLAIEVEGRDADVSMTAEPQAAGESPTWTATIDVGAEPIRYRFAWRSSWNGDVTEWLRATPTTD